ncbi:hypothetical protein AAY473_018943 [Plecturocebus cupreus]
MPTRAPLVPYPNRSQGGPRQPGHLRLPGCPNSAPYRQWEENLAQ